jgi:hypothetical protein
MKKKKFSLENGSLRIHQNDIRLYSSMHDENGRSIVASTDINDVVNYGLFLLPSTLIRKQKSDEELAWENYPDKEVAGVNGRQNVSCREERAAFIAGIKVYGDKEFHFTSDELENLLYEAREQDTNNFYLFDIDYLILTTQEDSIYPHTITVDYKDGNYFWKTLNPIY